MPAQAPKLHTETRGFEASIMAVMANNVLPTIVSNDFQLLFYSNHLVDIFLCMLKEELTADQICYGSNERCCLQDER